MIDLFGILINQDFFTSLVDVNKEKDISVLAGVPFPTPRALFALLARLVIFVSLLSHSLDMLPTGSDPEFFPQD